jgi:hypothetical protein
MALPFIPKGALRGATRKASKAAAKMFTLEARSKLSDNLMTEIENAEPNAKKFGDKFRWILNGIHAAEGQHLDYDKIREGRQKLEDIVAKWDPSTHEAMNARLEGSTGWQEKVIDDAGEFERVFNIIKDNQIQTNVDIIKETERLGLPKPDLKLTSKGYHPRQLATDYSQKMESLGNWFKNVWELVPFTSRQGLSEANKPEITDAIGSWIHGNATWNDATGKIEWREGYGRGWWESKENGRIKGPMFNGRALNPDNIKTKEEFEFWRRNEPYRLSDVLVSDDNAMGNNSIDDIDIAERDLILPLLGSKVHNISTMGMLREVEHRKRNLKAMQAMPDGFFTELKNLSNQLETISTNRSNHQLTPEQKETTALINDLLDLIGDDKNFFNLTGDAYSLIGAGPSRNRSNSAIGAIDNWIGKADNVLSPLAMGANIGFNPGTGVRQVTQGATANVARKPTSFLEASKNIVKSRFGKLNVMRGPTRGANVGMTDKAIDNLQALSNNSERIEAAVIATTVSEAKKRIMQEPDQYLKRMMSPDAIKKARVAIQSGDEDGFFNLIRPLIVRELEQVNGVNIVTSTPAISRSSNFGKSASRFISTPALITGSILNAKGKGGSQQSSNPKLARLAALGLLGTQAFTNAAISSSPYLMGAGAIIGGSAPLGALYMLRGKAFGDNSTETKQKQKLETLTSMATSGSLLDKATLAGAMAAEAIPTKAFNSGDFILAGRSNLDRLFGASTNAYRGGSMDALSTVVPSITYPMRLATESYKAVNEGGLLGLIGSDSPLLMLRSILPNTTPPVVTNINLPSPTTVETPDTRELTKKQNMLRIR